MESVKQARGAWPLPRSAALLARVSSPRPLDGRHRGRLFQRGQTALVARIRIDEQQLLANAAGAEEWLLVTR